MEPEVRILIIGGTGFVGYHALKEALKHGHEVSVLALPPVPADDLLPQEVKATLSDLNKLSDENLLTHLKNQEAVVFAAGADDRTIHRAPAYESLFEANVKACVRLFTLARKAGVKRGVLISSYFAHFDRICPEKRLSHFHPYIRSRQEQEKRSLKAAMPDLELMILELPYVFGSMPGRLPLWKPLVDYIHSPFPLFYTRGGTNIIAVKHVAEAIIGAIEQGKGGERYLIGEENVSWIDLLRRLSILAGGKKKVIILPNYIVREAMRMIALYHKMQGKEAGLNPVEFTKIQTINTFFDPEPSRNALGYGHGGIEEALQDTVRACLSR